MDSGGKPLTFKDRLKLYSKDQVLNETLDIDCNDGTMCKMTVTVDTANYGPCLYWQVICDKPFNKNWDTHPFCKLKFLEPGQLEIGGVVFNNEPIKDLLLLLVKKDKDMEDLVGSRSTVSYRASIIASLFQLRD